MLKGSCHCGAATFEVPDVPAYLNACNCSVCRRYGTLWAYYEADAVRFGADPDATVAYAWGEKSIAFSRCRTCGCVTDWRPTAPGSDRDRVGVNARLLEPASLLGVPIRHGDGASAA